MAAPGFWGDPAGAARQVARLKSLKGRVDPLRAARKTLDSLRELVDLAEGDTDPATLDEVSEESAALDADIQRLEVTLTLGGEHDGSNAFLSVQAGAGGTDSCDWAQMLVRMYLRWCEQRGFTAEQVDYLAAEEAGIRSATLRVVGSFAYGYLKGEMGVHRLVRISPFDANKRRQTSFAAVEVLPEVEDEEVVVEEKDLKIETHRSSGAGGQHVNKTDSAVRIIHIPTGLRVDCQNERSQHKNRATAMKILKGHLVALREEQRKSKLEAIGGEKTDIAWGHQIRSYVLAPYRLVKDHRTDVERGDVYRVLDGDIDPFLAAWLKWRLKQGQEARP